MNQCLFRWPIGTKLVYKNNDPFFDAYIDGLVQDNSNSNAKALELLQSCTKPSTYVTKERVFWVSSWHLDKVLT